MTIICHSAAFCVYCQIGSVGVETSVNQTSRTWTARAGRYVRLSGARGASSFCERLSVDIQRLGQQHRVADAAGPTVEAEGVAHHLGRCEFLVGRIPERGFVGEAKLQAARLISREAGQLPVRSRLQCGRIVGRLYPDECPLRVAPLDRRTRSEIPDSSSVLVGHDCPSEREQRREGRSRRHGG